jgi:cell division protein FtsW (lipid II flippase)
VDRFRFFNSNHQVCQARVHLCSSSLSKSPTEIRHHASLRGLGMTVLPFLLILKEPDLGSALVLLPVGWS